MTEDARRLARRFHDVFETFGSTHMDWDEVPLEYKTSLIKTFDELIAAQVVFPGPSLYSDPSV